MRKITVSTGIITTIAGTGSYGHGGDGGAATSAALCDPMGIEVDSSGRPIHVFFHCLFIYLSPGNVYLTEHMCYYVRKITASTGTISTIAGTGTGAYSGDNGAATSAALWYPYDLTVDNAGIKICVSGVSISSIINYIFIFFL